MTHTPAALANIAGEAIYQDRNATTYYVTPPAARKDPHVLANIQVWSHFIARQYNPETVDQAVSEWIDEDYVWYGLNVPQGIRGPGVRKGFMKNALGTSQGLSDFHITNRMFGEGDRVVNFWQMEGVHTGEYCGQPPSGKKVRFTGIAISSFRNGKQLEEWEYNEDFMANVKAVVDADVAKALATELTEREQSMVENIANWQQTVDEKMNLGRFDRIDSTYSEDYVYHGGGGFELSGPAALSRMKSGIEGFRAAFSDLKITNDMFGDGDRAVNHFVIEGTHDGVYGEFAPTGRKIRVAGIAISRFKAGRLVEEWEFVDQISLYLQLGVIPDDVGLLDLVQALRDKVGAP